MPVHVSIVRSTESVDNVRWYHVQVNDGGQEWMVKKRYRDFVMLDSQLAALGGLRLNLPSKGVFHSKSDAKFLNERQASLSRYLTHQAQQISSLAQSPVLRQFLMKPNAGTAHRMPDIHAGLDDFMGEAEQMPHSFHDGLHHALIESVASDVRAPEQEAAAEELESPAIDLAAFLDIPKAELPDFPNAKQQKGHSYGGAPGRRHSLNTVPFLGVRPLGRIQTDVMFRFRRLIRDGDAHGAGRILDRARQLDVEEEEMGRAQEQLRALEKEGQLVLLLPPVEA